MSVNWEAIKQEYIKSNGQVKLKDLANKYGVKPTTLRSRKKRDCWDEELQNVATGNVANKKATQKQKKSVATATKKKTRKAKVELEENDLGLTEKQKLFAEIYIKNFNATQAAIKAGYSPKTAFVIGHENLKKPKIKEYINYLKNLKKEAIMLSEDDIVEKYMRIAFADMTDFVDFGQEEVPVITKDGPLVDENGNLIKIQQNVINFKNSNQVDGGLISEIKQSRQGVSIKLEDRLKALKWLADFFEMNPEHKHKKEYDAKKLQLERERFEHTKEIDSMKGW